MKTEGSLLEEWFFSSIDDGNDRRTIKDKDDEKNKVKIRETFPHLAIPNEVIAVVLT